MTIKLQPMAVELSLLINTEEELQAIDKLGHQVDVLDEKPGEMFITVRIELITKEEEMTLTYLNAILEVLK